jgi:hypothetical protein
MQRYCVYGSPCTNQGCGNVLSFLASLLLLLIIVVDQRDPSLKAFWAIAIATTDTADWDDGDDDVVGTTTTEPLPRSRRTRRRSLRIAL